MITRDKCNERKKYHLIELKTVVLKWNNSNWYVQFHWQSFFVFFIDIPQRISVATVILTNWWHLAKNCQDLRSGESPNVFKAKNSKKGGNNGHDPNSIRWNPLSSLMYVKGNILIWTFNTSSHLLQYSVSKKVNRKLNQ